MKKLCAIAAVVAVTCGGLWAEPWFADVTAEVGVEGGPGAAWADYDGDGWVDVYIGQTLFHNERGKRFTRANDSSLRGGLWGDYDNDGDLDSFSWSPPGYLFLNNGDGTFSDATAGVPPLPTVVSLGACCGDLNGDGFLDLYVPGYEVGAHPDTIYINQGDASFVEHWRTPPDQLQPARGVTAADFDNDADIDIYVSNYRLQPNLLWRNDGSLVFTNVAHEYGVAGDGGQGAYGHTIGSAWGDLDNDGYLDLFVGNFSHPPAYQDRPMFLRNQGPPDYHFEDMSSGAGLQWQESFASPALGDFDNDGDLDLYFTTVYSGDHSVLYRNDGNWHFTDVTAEAGIDAAGTYQAAWADYDNDGDLDLLTGGKLYENQVASGHWLKVRLAGPGSAIGAQVRIQLPRGEKPLARQVLTRQVESSTGEGNQNDLTLHFGLGAHSGPVLLEISWPNGEHEMVPTPVDRLITVVKSGYEAEELPSFPSLAANALICPIREDFADYGLELPEGIWLPLRRTEKLGPLHPNARLEEVEGALGAGRGSGPHMGAVNDPQHPSKWYSSIRYIVYNTPEAARASAFRENYLLFGTAPMPGRGSFSGAEIGDLCGWMSFGTSSYVLHFVRDCVSVEIWARVREPYRDEPLQELIENVLEMTAKVIVKRVDGIVAAKGKVDMTNLPPIWTETVDEGGGPKEAP